MINPLAKIKTPGLAVDIDETLSYTIGHLVEHMQSKFGNPENLSIKEIIEKYRYTQNVPYWQSEEALKWIDQKIQSNKLQIELPLIEGADIYLNKINQIIPISAYITVRPEKVIKGTQEWLSKHKFPLAPIICRPIGIDHKDGNQWKAEVLQKLYPKILGLIDDNPKLLQFLPADYPGVIFLYDHGQIDSYHYVINCPQWPDVYQAVQKYF